MQTSVLLVDDHSLFRKGLRLLLEEEDDLKVVGEAGDGQAAYRTGARVIPGCDRDGHQHARPGWHRGDPAHPGRGTGFKNHRLVDPFEKGFCPGDAAGRGGRIYLEAKRTRRSGDWDPGGASGGGIFERHRSRILSYQIIEDFLSGKPAIKDQGSETIPSPIADYQAASAPHFQKHHIEDPLV